MDVELSRRRFSARSQLSGDDALTMKVLVV
jgi:hypothetical protein